MKGLNNEEYVTLLIISNVIAIIQLIAAIKWPGIALGLFVMEEIILLLFKMTCPLTIMARKYSSSRKENFDIFLPNWLAKNNKRIYTGFPGIILIILAYRLITK